MRGIVTKEGPNVKEPHWGIPLHLALPCLRYKWLQLGEQIVESVDEIGGVFKFLADAQH